MATIDERLEFLLQSTESLHATVLEQSAQIQRHSEQIQEHSGQIQKHSEQLEVDADNIRRLANIAASHEQRLEELE